MERFDFFLSPPIQLSSSRARDDMRWSSLIRPIYYCESGKAPAASHQFRSNCFVSLLICLNRQCCWWSHFHGDKINSHRNGHSALLQTPQSGFFKEMSHVEYKEREITQRFNFVGVWIWTRLWGHWENIIQKTIFPSENISRNISSDLYLYLCLYLYLSLSLLRWL